MSREQLTALVEFVDALVVSDGCDHTLRHTRTWVEGQGRECRGQECGHGGHGIGHECGSGHVNEHESGSAQGSGSTECRGLEWGRVE